MQIDNDSNQPKLAQVMALINPSALSINTITSTYSLDIDPMFPARKSCSADSVNTILLEDNLVFLVKSLKKNVYVKN